MICLVQTDAIKMLIPHVVGVYTGARLSEIYLSFLCSSKIKEFKLLM